MFSKIFSALLVPTLFLVSTVQAIGAVVNLDTVGPLTPLSAKSKICNVLNYGAFADNKTDIGPAISKAFSSCVVGGGATLYIPPGSYSSKYLYHLRADWSLANVNSCNWRHSQCWQSMGHAN